ncbi:hypothetical protein PMAYCL1PPCAC_13713, partial [Pristionchus mayeri]
KIRTAIEPEIEMRTVYRRSPTSSYEKLSLDGSDEECSSSSMEISTPPPSPLWLGARNRGVEQWELGKVLFIVSFFWLSALSNWAVLAYTHDFAGWEPMPDIVFKFVPEIQIAHKMGDYFVTSSLICLVLLIVFHKHRLIVFRRMVFIIATLYFMRTVTLLGTYLPPSYSDNARRCREQHANFSLERLGVRMFEQAIRFGMQDETGKLCGDMLFSGHTLVMMVCMLTVTHYIPKKWRLLRFFPYCFTYVGMACMIVSRRHYTIDVVIAHWLTTFVFTSYHAYIESDQFSDRRQSVFHSYAYFRLIGWLEANIVPGRLENVFESPSEAVLALLGVKPKESAPREKLGVEKIV